MASKIVSRLRGGYSVELRMDAADEIERLHDGLIDMRHLLDPDVGQPLVQAALDLCEKLIAGD